jgi:hypothetical protein
MERNPLGGLVSEELWIDPETRTIRRKGIIIIESKFKNKNKHNPR